MPRGKRAAVPEASQEVKKPAIGLPDPLEAAQEIARHHQEGNRKLALAVDALRGALETIVVAELDNRTGLPVTPKDLRDIAIGGLDEYSKVCGQNWRRHKLIGSWAQGTGNKPVRPELEA